MLHRYLCETCGGNLTKVDESHYRCESCGNEYSTEKVENYVEKMKEVLDDAKLEMISKARKNLYSAISNQYISKHDVIKWCDEVKKYLPDDFQANFYYDFINAPKKEVAKNIRKIDVKAHFELLEPLIVFVAKSLEKSYVAALKDLIERAYKFYKSDIEKYIKYTTMVENEAEKLDKGMYVTKQPRKAFVAYSSKDSDKAIELVEVLESQGISCFISLRNLRHGVGSQENYASALKEAMDNCMSFVFVSSMNSRNIECDAYQLEMPYIMQCDKNNAPGNLRNYYKNIPQEYKKPRVEYRIEESSMENFADDFVEEFFDGYERAYTIKDVAHRILEQARRSTESVQTQQKVEAPKAQTSSVDALVKRVFMFLEDGEWKSADEYCEKVLDQDPENARAYLGKLMVELKVKKQEQLKKCAKPFDGNLNYQKIVRFGDEKLKKTLQDDIEYINARNEKARLESLYNNARKAMSSAISESDYKSAAQMFEAISEYQDSDILSKTCYEKAEIAQVRGEKILLERNKLLNDRATITNRINELENTLYTLQSKYSRAASNYSEAQKNKKINIYSSIIILYLLFAIILGFVLYSNNLLTDDVISFINDFSGLFVIVILAPLAIFGSLIYRYDKKPSWYPIIIFVTLGIFFVISVFICFIKTANADPKPYKHEMDLVSSDKQQIFDEIHKAKQELAIMEKRISDFDIENQE